MVGRGLAVGAALALGCAGAGDEGVDIGQVAPDIVLPDRDGVERSLSELAGQVVLLEFSAMWCTSCQATAPAAQQVYEEQDGFTVFNVLIHDENQGAPSVEDAGRWADGLGLTFPVLADETGSTKATWQPLQGLPASWMLDADGVITWSHRGTLGADELTAEVDAAR